jgi:hypothetical protein
VFANPFLTAGLKDRRTWRCGVHNDMRMSEMWQRIGLLVINGLVRREPARREYVAYGGWKTNGYPDLRSFAERLSASAQIP